MKDYEILDTLCTAVTAAVAASDTIPTTAVKMPSRTFAPPDDQKYLEVVFIPNNDGGDRWGDGKNFAGLLRLILHWPNDDAGALVPGGVLASICAYFSNGRVLNGVQIVGQADARQPLENPTETLYPASLRYNSFHP